MAAQRPVLIPHRDYIGSEEYINGFFPSNDQQLSAEELNTNIIDVLKSHADLLDSSELKWYPGYTLSNTWVNDDDGRKVSYYSAIGATAEQLATIEPGTNTAAWVLADLFSADDRLKLDSIPAPVAGITITDRYGATVGGGGVFISGQLVTVEFAGGASNTTIVDSNGTWTMTVPAGADEGTMTATVVSIYDDSLSVTAVYLLQPNGYGSPLANQLVTQTVLDNGITLQSGVTSLSDTNLTVDEAGGLKQTAGTDYTITGKLLEFTGPLSTSLQAGIDNSTPYTIQFSWG